MSLAIVATAVAGLASFTERALMKTETPPDRASEITEVLYEAAARIRRIADHGGTAIRERGQS